MNLRHLLLTLLTLTPTLASHWIMSTNMDIPVPYAGRTFAYAGGDSANVPSYMLWVGTGFTATNSNVTPIKSPLTFKPGTNYFIWAKVLEYSTSARKIGFHVGDGFATNTVALNKADANGYWSVVGPVVSSIASTNFAIEVFKTNFVTTTDKYLLMGVFITDNDKEAVPSKLVDMAQIFDPPSGLDPTYTSGNLVPNASFETGELALGWSMYDALGERPSLATYWSDTYAAHGKYSWKSQSRDILYSPIIELKHPNRGYTLSLSARPTSLVADQSILIVKLYNSQTIPTDIGLPVLTNTWQSTLQFTDTNAFQRKTFFVNTPLWNYPTGTVQFSIERRSNPSTYDPLYIDAIQLEEGPAATTFDVATLVEIGLRTSVPGNVFIDGDALEVQVISYNTTGSSTNVECLYEVRNIRNELVQSGTPTLTMPSGNGTNTIALTFSANGPYRMTFWGATAPADEITFSILPTDGLGGTTNDWIGTHFNTASFPVSLHKRLGYAKLRTLSPAAWFRWGGPANVATETSSNVFSFPTAAVSNLLASGISPLISLNTNPTNFVPSWWIPAIMAGGGASAYSNWIYNLVSTLSPLGVRRYEMWNEMQRAFDGTYIPVSQQTNLQSAMIDAVYAADPTAEIVAFGGVNFAPEGLSIYSGLSPTQKSRLGAASYHIYALNNNPNAPYLPGNSIPDWQTAFPTLPLINSESGLEVIGGFAKGHSSGFNSYASSFAQAYQVENRYYEHDFAYTRLAYELFLNIGRGIEWYFYDSRYSNPQNQGPGLSTTQTGLESDDSLKPHGYYAALYNNKTRGFTPFGSSFTNTGAADGIEAVLFTKGTTNWLALLNRGYTLCRLTTGLTAYRVFDAEWNEVTRSDLTRFDLGRWPLFLWSTTLTTNQMITNFVNATVTARSDTVAPNLSIDWSPKGLVTIDDGILRLKAHATDNLNIPNSSTGQNLTNLAYRAFLSGYDNDWSEWGGNTFFHVPASQLSRNLTYQWQVQVRDLAGNTSSATSPTFYIDPTLGGGITVTGRVTLRGVVNLRTF